MSFPLPVLLSIGLEDFLHSLPRFSARTSSLVLIGLVAVYIAFQMARLLCCPSEEPVYKGDRDDQDRYHGQGRLELASGDLYEGEFVAGKFHGHGKFTFGASRCSYTGEFARGIFHGTGTETYQDGSVYKGQFFYGLRHGRGNMKYGDGSIYDGEWKDGKKCGLGVFKYVDGSEYHGEFVNGKRHGKGKIKEANGKGMRMGKWEEGKEIVPAIEEKDKEKENEKENNDGVDNVDSLMIDREMIGGIAVPDEGDQSLQARLLRDRIREYKEMQAEKQQKQQQSQNQNQNEKQNEKEGKKSQ